MTVVSEYLQGVGVPVVRMNLADIQETVDQLHDYLLQCMALSMGSTIVT